MLPSRALCFALIHFILDLLDGEHDSGVYVDNCFKFISIRRSVIKGVPHVSSSRRNQCCAQGGGGGRGGGSGQQSWGFREGGGETRLIAGDSFGDRQKKKGQES